MNAIIFRKRLHSSEKREFLIQLGTKSSVTMNGHELPSARLTRKMLVLDMSYSVASARYDPPFWSAVVMEKDDRTTALGGTACQKNETKNDFGPPNRTTRTTKPPPTSIIFYSTYLCVLGLIPFVLGAKIRPYCEVVLLQQSLL